MTLATKLPYSHPFAGGYPRIGGQPLPTDPDAIDYLERVKAADGGAAVEVGVAMAVDQFVKGCKADSAGYAGDPTRTVWDALQACCILCGARTISGALVPLVGDAPTAYPQPVNFVSADYDRSSGLQGDGSTKYLDSNRANNADPQDDKHLAVYASQLPTAGLIYAGSAVSNATSITASSPASSYVYGRVNSGVNIAQASPQVGFFGTARASASVQQLRANGVTTPNSTASGDPGSDNIKIYARYAGDTFTSNARIAFYSIGTSVDLAAMDNRVSTLVSQIAAAIP